MRIVALFLNLYLILLCGGHNSYADTHHGTISHTSTHHNLAQNKQLKFSSNQQNTTISENIYFDLEEDYVGTGSTKEKNKDKVLLTKGNVSNGWHFTFISLFISEYYSKSFKTSPPFNGYSSPIYIKNGVLRI